MVPELDDEFAKDLGDFENLEALRARVRADLEHEAKHESERDARGELLKQLASRVTFDVPTALLDREIDRRMEDFVRRLMDQQIDPMKVNINWEEFREKQRDAAAEAVRGALALDEVARREHIAVERRRGQRGSGAVCRTERPRRGRRARQTREGRWNCTPLLGVAPRKDRGVPSVEGHKDSGRLSRYTSRFRICAAGEKQG